MSNGFQFKQFYIRHDLCAMKVTEMACLLGVLAPIAYSVQTIADFGTGTGLLACMLAQRSHAAITALELDQNAVLQAQENVVNSPFSERIDVIQSDIRQFTTSSPFDLIVCNPPFFEKQLPSQHVQKAAAWHDTTLRLNELFESVERNLSPGGQFVLLLPASRLDDAIQNAYQYHLCLSHHWTIFHKPNAQEGFVVLGFQRGSNLPTYLSNLTLRNAYNEYSPIVTQLLKPFYLYL